MMTEFVFPRSTFYPFDAVCSEIVRALYEAHWRPAGFPDLRVSLARCGNGHRVAQINGDDFMLKFSRMQGLLDDRSLCYDCSAVSEILIPGKLLMVSHISLEPVLLRYVGDNWPRDRAYFMAEVPYDSKARGEPRLYLLYRAQKRQGQKNSVPCWIDFEHFVHSSGGGKEYGLGDGDPRRLETAEVFAAVKDYLEKEVLKPLLPN